MSQTFAQKALARASGVADPQPGQIVDAFPDVYMSHTASWRCIQTLKQLGTDKLYDRDRIAMVMDHLSPAYTAKTAADQRMCREFAERMGIKNFFDVDSGIAHIVLMERGIIRPGQLIIGTDSHSTIYGALGAFGTGVGFSEITAAWVTGKLWMRVPESLRIQLDGEFPAGTYAKDLMLYLIGKVGADGATYESVEFHGDLVGSLSVSERMTLANLGMEMGCKNAFIPPDQKTRDYLYAAGLSDDDIEEIQPDDDAVYRHRVDLDVSTLEPQIAAPHTVENVVGIGAVAGTKVDQVFVGSCANAKLDDLLIVADLLKGRRVAPGVRLIVTPASRMIMAHAGHEGALTTLLEAGAMLTNPGCGACAGNGGAMADGEVTLSTANRNFRGRMGSYDASIYLSSPATAAASAITGVITDPREIVR